MEQREQRCDVMSGSSSLAGWGGLRSLAVPGGGVAGVEHGLGEVAAVGEGDLSVDAAAVLVPPVRYECHLVAEVEDRLEVGECVFACWGGELGRVAAEEPD